MKNIFFSRGFNFFLIRAFFKTNFMAIEITKKRPCVKDYYLKKLPKFLLVTEIKQTYILSYSNSFSFLALKNFTLQPWF